MSRREFLYDLQYWEVRRIIQGYHRRYRNMWSAIRWATYNIMCTSMADIKKAGIYKPTDLIKFPWDVKQDGGGGNQPTEEEIEYLRQLMTEENARLKDGEH